MDIFEWPVLREKRQSIAFESARKHVVRLGKSTQISSIGALVHLDLHMCTLLSNNPPVFPASPWLPCRSAARRLGASDPTTWPTSAAPAAAITPAPPRRKRRRRSGGSRSKGEAEKRGKRKFLTTLARARTRTWQSAQVNPQRSAGDLFCYWLAVLFIWCISLDLEVMIFHFSLSVLICEILCCPVCLYFLFFAFFWVPLVCVCVFTQHPIETRVPLFGFFIESCCQIYASFFFTNNNR